MFTVEGNVTERKYTREHWEETWKEPTDRMSKFGVTKISAQYRRLVSLFNQVMPSEGRKLKLLDVGCGEGKWLVYFKEHFGFDVYGVDYSEEAYVTANRTLKTRGIDGVVIQQDFLADSFQTQYKEFFDVVVSMGVIEHFTDVGWVVDRYLNLLKPNGLLFTDMPNFCRDSFYRRANRFLGHEQSFKGAFNADIMEIETFRKIVRQSKNLEILKLGYF